MISGIRAMISAIKDIASPSYEKKFKSIIVTLTFEEKMDMAEDFRKAQGTPVREGADIKIIVSFVCMIVWTTLAIVMWSYAPWLLLVIILLMTIFVTFFSVAMGKMIRTRRFLIEKIDEEREEYLNGVDV